MKAWKNVANKYLVQKRSSHFAPQPEELVVFSRLSKKIFQKRLFQKKRPSLLVLGATPEFRDWGLQNNCDVFAVDINPEMIENVKKFLYIKDRRQEKMLIGDWLKLPIEDGSIDFVVGDVSLNNLPYNKFPKVLAELKRVLSPDGLICVKEVIYPKTSDGIPNFKRSVTLYRKGKLSTKEFYVFNRFYNFRSAAYDKKTHKLYAEKVFQAFDKKYEQGKLSKEEHEELNKFRNKIIHTVFDVTEYKNLTLKHFSSFRLHSAKGEKYYKNIFRILLINN
jgi:ubiquinone/menaquinone biosynthesis C-methylase UbiE